MNIKNTLIAIAVTALFSANANAAIEIDEANFGPTYGTAVADVLVAKPLQFVGAVAGTALHVVGLPFSYASNSVDTSYDTLVRKPWAAMGRCVGCSEAYDNYRLNQNTNPNEVRLLVERPSEIIINTDQKIVVN